MAAALPQPIRTVLAAYVAGTLTEDELHAQLGVPSFAAGLRALAGQSLTLDSAGQQQVVIRRAGDTITTGNITDSKGIAIGRDAVAIGEINLYFYVTLPAPIEAPEISTQPPIEIPHLAVHAEWQLGRDAELDALHTALQQVTQTRRGQVAFITGKDGYGKSALVHSFVAEVLENPAEQGVAIIQLRFWPTASLPADEIERLYADDPQLQRSAALVPHIRRWWPIASAGKTGAAFVWMMAQLADALGAIPQPTAIMPDHLDALRHTLRQLARQRPLILAWEHLEDAPDVWIYFLSALLPEVARELPILLIGTLRLTAPIEQLSGELGVVEALVRELHSTTQAQVFWLETLTNEDVAAFLGAADPRLAPQLLRLTSGVPYLIESLWQSWIGAGVIAEDTHERWGVVNDRLGWVFGEQFDLARRLLRLGLLRNPLLPEATAMEILHVAALEGPSFTAQVIARVVNCDLDLVRDLFDEALLRSDDFPDGMISEVGYAELEGVATNELPNIYRYATPYLQEVWRKYAPSQRVQAWQRRMIDALRSVYLRNPALIEERLVPLLESSGDTQTAQAIRNRWRAAESRTMREQALFFLEQTAHGHSTAAYQLFDVRMELAEDYYDAGDYARGLTLAEAAQAQAAAWGDRIRQARTSNMAGMCLLQLGDYAAALRCFQHTIAILEQELGPIHPDTGTSLNNLASVYRAMGEYAQALPLYIRALAIAEAALGATHPETGMRLNNLATLYRAMGEYAQALPLAVRALAIAEAALGANHPETGTSLNNLANLYESLGEYTQALPLYQRALAIAEAAQGAMHPSTGTSLNNLAGLYRAMGEYTQALPLLQRALAIAEAAQGAKHPETGTSLNNLAELYRAMGDYAQALPLLQRALAIAEAAQGANHPATGTRLNNLAGLYRAMGEYAQALPLFVRALAIVEATLGTTHPNTQATRQNLTRVLTAISQAEH